MGAHRYAMAVLHQQAGIAEILENETTSTASAHPRITLNQTSSAANPASAALWHFARANNYAAIRYRHPFPKPSAGAGVAAESHTHRALQLLRA